MAPFEHARVCGRGRRIAPLRPRSRARRARRPSAPSTRRTPRSCNPTEANNRACVLEKKGVLKGTATCGESWPFSSRALSTRACCEENQEDVRDSARARALFAAVFRDAPVDTWLSADHAALVVGDSRSSNHPRVLRLGEPRATCTHFRHLYAPNSFVDPNCGVTPIYLTAGEARAVWRSRACHHRLRFRLRSSH